MLYSNKYVVHSASLILPTRWVAFTSDLTNAKRTERSLIGCTRCASVGIYRGYGRVSVRSKINFV